MPLLETSIPRRLTLLVVGSSPMSLVFALHAARAGFAVTLVERSDRLGGAWAAETIDGQVVERACHLFEPAAGARRWLLDSLDIECNEPLHAPASVTPWGSFWNINTRRQRCLEFALAWPAAARHLLMARRTGDRDEVSRVRLECTHDMGRLWRRLTNEVRFGHSAALTLDPPAVTRLAVRATAAAEEVMLGSTVQSISKRTGDGNENDLVVSIDDTDCTFDQVVLPSGVDVDVIDNGRTLDVSRFHFDNHHVLFEAVPGTRAFTYMRLVSSARLRRVVDCGRIDSGRTGDDATASHRFLAQVRDKDTPLTAIMSELADLNLVDDDGPSSLLRTFEYRSTRTIFNEPLPDGVWAPDTYGDLSDNLARLLHQAPSPNAPFALA